MSAPVGAVRKADDRRPLPTTAVVLELARLAWTRVTRSSALWVVAAMGALPAVLALVMAAKSTDSDAAIWRVLFETALPLMTVVPPVLVASAVADELEDKTSAYLWSRALPRWSVVVGKLLVLAPVSALLVGGAGLLAALAARLPPAIYVDGVIGMAAGAATAATIAAMIATLVPRHAVAMTMGWLVIVDWPLHFLTFGVRHISSTFGAGAIAGLAPEASALSGALTLVVLAAIAVAVACWRIGHVE